MRVDEDQPWHPFYLAQPLWNLINACFFEYGIAVYDLEIGKRRRRAARTRPSSRPGSRACSQDPQAGDKDYVVHPLLSGPSALTTLAANVTANLVRNLWTHSVIMCGHFPEGVETFEKTSIDGETRGEWYLRQMLGSANITGGPLMHLMTGNLSFQIEHHLFPDLPSNRYQEIAPKVAGALRALRPDVHQRPAAQAGRLRLEEGLPPRAPQRRRARLPRQSPPRSLASCHQHSRPPRRSRHEDQELVLQGPPALQTMPGRLEAPRNSWTRRALIQARVPRDQRRPEVRVGDRPRSLTRRRRRRRIAVSGRLDHR